MIATILSVLAIHLLAVMMPGPDFIVTVKYALTYGRKAGIRTAIGVWLWIGVHVLYSVVWLAFIISQSIVLFSIIKYLWAAYLIYIWIQSLRAKSSPQTTLTATHQEHISSRKAFQNGFLTNVLNPKATLFFLGLFTLVISPETPKSTIAIAGVMMMIDTAIWFSIVAIFLTTKRVQKVYHKIEYWLNKVFGGLLILFWIKVALSSVDK